MADIGTSTYVQFCTSSWFPLVRYIEFTVDRERVNMTTFTSGAMEFTPSTLQTVKTISLDLLFTPNKAATIPIAGGTEIINIVFPTALFQVNAFLESFTFQAGIEDLMSARVVLLCSGPMSYYDNSPLINDAFNWCYNDDANLVYAG